jgi:Siphovirus Gp157
MNLYKATELARLESHIDEETGEIDLAAFDAAQIALTDKQRAVVAYIRNAEATETMLANTIKELQAKQKAMKAKRERLKEYLIENMKTAGITKIEAADGTFSAALYPDRDVSVMIEDGATFPPELCNDPKPPEPSKTKIKAAIEAGQAISGACIVRSDRLTIK